MIGCSYEQLWRRQSRGIWVKCSFTKRVKFLKNGHQRERITHRFGQIFCPFQIYPVQIYVKTVTAEKFTDRFFRFHTILRTKRTSELSSFWKGVKGQPSISRVNRPLVVKNSGNRLAWSRISANSNRFTLAWCRYFLHSQCHSYFSRYTLSSWSVL